MKAVKNKINGAIVIANTEFIFLMKFFFKIMTTVIKMVTTFHLLPFLLLRCKQTLKGGCYIINKKHSSP